jgi:outer membrane biosynthesis protein TonB
MDRSERLGLGVSTAGHVLLFGALSLGLLQTSVTLPPPQQTIDVSIADDVALTSSTPNPSTVEPEAAQAPEIGAYEPDAAPPEPVEAPRVVEPEPAPRAIEPKPKPQPRQQAKPTPAKVTQPPKPAPKPQRASRLGNDFLKGLDDAPPMRDPAPAAGANAPLSDAAARALNAEISRQLKRFWRAPTGADAERLVTKLRWRLNRDGTLASDPELVEQLGRTDSNRPQQELHVEAAKRAVRAAAPFNLPAEYYDSWRYIESFSFDKRL